jgi:lysophospholipase L1-like esterase
LFAAADSLLGALGERREFDVVPDRQRAQLAATRLQAWEPSRDDIATIRRTVRELTDQGISVVLTPMPTPPRFVALHPDGAQDLATFNAALEELATDLDVPLIDVAVGYDDDDFVDYTHLNEAGAHRFTRQLTAVLNGSERQEEPPAEWELLADIVPDGTEDTTDRRVTVEDRAAAAGQRSVLAAEDLHSALSPSRDLFGIEVPLVWANGFHRTKQLQLAELAAADESPEVLFAGTSKVWYGIDADLFTEVDGRRSYNAGLPAAGPAAQRSWMLDVVEPTAEPEVVIWGVSAYDVSGRLDSTSQRIVDAVELQQQLFAPLAWSELMTGAEAVEEGAPETWIVAPEDVGVANRGQLRTEEVAFNETLENLVTYFVGAASEADAGELDAVRDTVKGLRSRNVEVIIVSMPVPDSFRALQPEGAADALTAAVDGVAEELGVDHLDLSRSMPEETFADYTHLTGTGATEFTRLLLDELDRLDED